MGKHKRYILKTISCLLICIFFICLFYDMKSNAIYQYKSNTIDELGNERYPGIKILIEKLKEKHPNWKFKILYTNLDWNDVIDNEYIGHGASPSNLIPSDSNIYNDKWICDICGETRYDTGGWICASREAIKYMMDVRNWLDDENVFQFLELTYDSCDYNQIKSMVNDTFLNNDSYINTIINASKSFNVNPYYIVARIIQEQGKEGNILAKGTGYNGSYIGYYNVFNIGAMGNTYDEVMINALKKAQKEGWTSIEESIYGGIRYLSINYISQGQNTIYLQKFDVENSDGIIYGHQYMQNLLASKNEAYKLINSIKKLNAMEKEYTFLIPVYENMPYFAQNEPNQLYESTNDLMKVNVSDNLRVRNTPGGIVISNIYSNENVERVEKAMHKYNGTYWDKIRTSNGIYGYVARQTLDSELEFKYYLVEYNNENSNSNNNIEEQPPKQILLGDVNMDGKISATDYVFIKNHIMKSRLLESNESLIAADVNKDGKISPTDYVKIKNYIMYGTNF